MSTWGREARIFWETLSFDINSSLITVGAKAMIRIWLNIEPQIAHIIGFLFATQPENTGAIKKGNRNRRLLTMFGTAYNPKVVVRNDSPIKISQKTIIYVSTALRFFLMFSSLDQSKMLVNCQRVVEYL